MEPELLEWADEDIAFQELTVVQKSGKRQWIFRDPELKLQLNTEAVRSLGRDWHTHPAFAITKSSQGIQRIQREADAFLAQLGYRHDLQNNCYYAERDWDGRVALFAHEGVGAAFLSCVLDIPYPIFSTRFTMSHTGVTVINFEKTDGIVIPQLMTYSNDSHIYREGLPTKFRNEVYF